MTRYSVEPRDQIFVKGYKFLSFSKNIGKNVIKNLSGKYSPCMLAVRQKLLNHAKQSATDVTKTASNRAIRITAAETADLICNKIANKITENSP